jgi:integrase
MSSIDTWDEIAGVEKFDLKIPTSHESDLNVRRSGDSIFCAPRRVRELLIQCIQGKRGEDYLFTRENGMPVKDFRGSWAKVCEEAGLPGLHFHDLRRTAARNMRRGHVAEKVAMEIRGLENNLGFSPLCDRRQPGHRQRHGDAGKKPG